MACTVIKDWPQKYNYNFVELVVDGDSRVRCKICDKNFPVSHGGENDITRHAAGPIKKKRMLFEKIPIN
jgi:hypothetical protein